MPRRSSTRATLEPEGTKQKRAPRLPKRAPGEQPWHKQTRAWWAAAWASPMAGEFLQADFHALARLAVLIDRFWYEPSHTLAAEIRLSQQAFGLTPTDRRRLDWEVARAERATVAKQQRQVRAALAGEADPRDVLKVLERKG